MSLRAPCLLLGFALMRVVGEAQLADQPPIDLSAGLIAEHAAAADLEASGLNLRVPQGTSVSDYALAFRLDLQQPITPGGKPLAFARVAGQSGPLLTLALTTSAVHVLRDDFSAPVVGALPAGGLNIVLSVRRDPRLSVSALWINGVEQSTFVTKPGKDVFAAPALRFDGIDLHQGRVSEVRLYDRALSRAEVIALASPGLPKSPLPISALIGGTEAVALAESGWLEARLLANEKPSTLRSLAWEGDSAFSQQRPLNFGSLTQQLARVQAQRAIVILGRQECLERAPGGVSAFRDAFAKLLSECPKGSLVIGPVPFETKPAPLPDLSAKNDDLSFYNEVLGSIAAAQGHTFVDVIKAWPRGLKEFTRDGVTLTDKGTEALAEIIAPSTTDTLPKLRSLAQEKDRLWHRYWRPSNWAFLYGDRSTQPSSRDHMNPSVRWFPQELENFRSLVEAKEAELLQARAAKLP